MWHMYILLVIPEVAMLSRNNFMLDYYAPLYRPTYECLWYKMLILPKKEKNTCGG